MTPDMDVRVRQWKITFRATAGMIDAWIFTPVICGTLDARAVATAIYGRHVIRDVEDEGIITV